MLYISVIEGSLKDRHIENGSELYAIFTPKKNLMELHKREMTNIKNEGPDVIRCHIMLQVLMYNHFNQVVHMSSWVYAVKWSVF